MWLILNLLPLSFRSGPYPLKMVSRPAVAGLLPGRMSLQLHSKFTGLDRQSYRRYGRLHNHRDPRFPHHCMVRMG